MKNILDKLLSNTRRIKPGQTLVLGFLFVILIGTVLLSLPVATKTPGSIGILDALFTSTSATCVTGLVAVNTGLTFSLFGRIVILLLIQIGGLGFMTVASLFFLMVGKRISLRERLIIQEAYNLDSIQGVVMLVRNAVIITFVAEAAGAVALSARLIPEFGFLKGVFHSIFLSVSSFCNAGFDVFGQSSLEKYVADPIINITVATLVTVGGLGFPVLLDIIRKRKFSLLTLQSRLVLIVSGALFLSGALFIGLFEWNNPQTLGNPELGVASKGMAACFQSVILRTAGFNTISQNGLTPAGLLFSTVLMFIGASPASTGGGIKTTSFFIVILSISCMVRGKQDYNIFKRRLGGNLMRKAFAIASLALALVLLDTIAISAVENITGGTWSLGQIMFEVVSAFGTVGLTTGITGSLYWVSKLLIIVTMFMGRLGPLTLSMAISGAVNKQDSLHYPEDRLIIG